MKQKLFLLTPTIFLAAHLFAQVKPLAEKKVITTPATYTKPLTNPKPAKTENPPPKPTDLQNASVSIISGDDGKDNDTYVFLDLLDNNKRVAATYNNSPTGTLFPARPNDEFYAGASVSLPMTPEASIPTADMKWAGGVQIPVLRQADLADFNNQGEVKIRIQPNGHDTWKIQTLSITFSFNNDGNSPHKITWSNIVLSQNNTTADLLFDKNFNPL